MGKLQHVMESVEKFAAVALCKPLQAQIQICGALQAAKFCMNGPSDQAGEMINWPISIILGFSNVLFFRYELLHLEPHKIVTILSS